MDATSGSVLGTLAGAVPVRVRRRAELAEAEEQEASGDIAGEGSIRAGARALSLRGALMDWLQFASSMFQSIVSLAWPAAVVACVWLFREKLIELLPQFRVKHKDWEASFRIEQAEKSAAELNPLPPSPDLQPTPEEKSRFEKLAELSPGSAILELRRQIEDSATQLAERYGKFAIPPGKMTLHNAIRVLRNQNIIDERTSALLDDFRVMGNRAAHSLNDEFTTEQAIRLRDLADYVLAQLNEAEAKHIVS